MPLCEQRAQVGTPCISCPPQDLLQKAPIGLHCAKQLGLLAALHVRRPSVADHPAGEKLVVARVELVLPHPVVVREAVQERRVLQDDCAICGGAARQARDAAVNVRRRRDLNVADGEAERGQNLPDRHALPDGLHALGCTDATDALVLEAC